MKEWKIRQQIYHKLNPNPGDLMVETDVKPFSTGNLELDEVMPPSAWFNLFYMKTVSYFEETWPDIVQPCKAYAVAIVYAKLLEKYFNEDFYQALNDSHLLFDNDKHFVPYQNNKLVYDAVVLGLQRRGLFDNLENIDLPQVQITISYFKKEFLLD